MKFHIVIHLSRNEIAFYYCRKDSDGRLHPFDGVWPAPLAIYCHGTELEIGESALYAANQQVTGAYTDIFKVATQSGFFDMNGSAIPLNKLLLHAIEYYIKKFLKETLMQNAGTLDDLRSSMSLNFIFNVNLKQNQTDYVIDLFKNNGYGNVQELDYNKYILQLLTARTADQLFTVFSSDGTDLYFRCYRGAWSSELIKFRGEGMDQRLEKAMKSIIADINDFDPYTNISDKELERIHKAAKSFLDSGELTVNDSITLDDGRQVPYYLALISLSTSGESCELLRTKVKSEFDRLGLNPSASALVLKGRNICNSYFRESLRPLFGQYYEVSGDKQSEVFNNIAADLLSQQRLKNIVELPKPPEPKPPHSGPRPLTPPPTPPTAPSIDERKMKRLWRETKENAITSIGNGEFKEAFKFVDQYEATCNQCGYTAKKNDIAEIRRLIERRQSEVIASKTEKENRVRRPSEKVGKPNQDNIKPKVVKTSVTETVDEGLELIAQGKLKEARDYYQSKGELQKAKQLKDILRSYQLLKPWFEEKNKTTQKSGTPRLKQILAELDAHISLCKSANVPCKDVIELKKHYNKIR